MTWSALPPKLRVTCCPAAMPVRLPSRCSTSLRLPQTSKVGPSPPVHPETLAENDPWTPAAPSTSPLKLTPSSDVAETLPLMRTPANTATPAEPDKQSSVSPSQERLPETSTDPDRVTSTPASASTDAETLLKPGAKNPPSAPPE